MDIRRRATGNAVRLRQLPERLQPSQNGLNVREEWGWGGVAMEMPDWMTGVTHVRCHFRTVKSSLKDIHKYAAIEQIKRKKILSFCSQAGELVAPVFRYWGLTLGVFFESGRHGEQTTLVLLHKCQLRVSRAARVKQ